jgi:8-oxo-dGTP pyrophosphatase MutT (NUDIX family)
VTDPGDELVEIVDDEDRVIEVVPRRVMRALSARHRCTYVFVLDRHGRVYVHRRTTTKDIYPGYLDVCAGGVNAVGETYEVAAARELEEELGVTAEPTLRFVARYDGADGRCFGGVFDVAWDGPIVWQPEEVVEGAFHTFQEIDAMREREPFCPDGLEMFDRWRRERGPA